MNGSRFDYNYPNMLECQLPCGSTIGVIPLHAMIYGSKRIMILVKQYSLYSMVQI